MTLPSGETAAAWKCLYKWIPILLIESAKETRHAAASSDKVANEIRGAGGDIIRRALKLPGPDQLLEQK